MGCSELHINAVLLQTESVLNFICIFTQPCREEILNKSVFIIDQYVNRPKRQG